MSSLAIKNDVAANSPRSSLLQPFYPALDGLRAIAFLLVFLVHYEWAIVRIPVLSPIFDWGWTGVDLFFVLSGFLITGILYDTLHSERFFRDFYTRRALRIFPLFYGIWIACLLLTPVLHIEWNRYNAAMAAYIGNFFVLGSSLHLHPNPGILLLRIGRPDGVGFSLVLGQFWSLCVEEQFYLVWPAVVWLVRSRTALLRISLGVVVAVLLLRLGYAHYHPDLVKINAIYFSTQFRVDTLFVGAAIALWLRGTSLTTAVIRRIAYATAVGAPLLLALGWRMTGPHVDVRIARDVYVDTYGYTLVAITAGAIIVLAMDPVTYLARALQQRTLSFLGRISYGLYALHAIPLILLVHVRDHLVLYHAQFLVVPVALAGTVGAAWLSFRYVESPFLRLKSVLAPQPATRLLPAAQSGPKPRRRGPAVFHPAA